MQRADYPASVRALVDELRHLPGIGPRSAERICLWLLEKPDHRPPPLAAALAAAAGSVRPCRLCGFFAENDLCVICDDPRRAHGPLCVVEHATDILPMERTGLHAGRYHALGGRLAPLDHVGPEDLRVDALLRRVETERPEEVILALSADVEGEATASYLADLLRGKAARVTRIAQGLPAGGGLEHADPLTLARALGGRVTL